MNSSENILIVTDLEGTPGMEVWDFQLHPDERIKVVARHQRVISFFCELLIQGDKFNKILVAEGHLRTLNSQVLPEGIEFITLNSVDSFLPPIDHTWRVAVIGAHGKEGGKEALAHTFSSRNPQKWFIDGVEVGEIGIIAAWAGSFNVPLVFVHGTYTACEEATLICPGVVTVASRMHGDSDLSEDEELSLIEIGCRQINEGKTKSLPWRILPAAKIERYFVGKSFSQRVRAKTYAFAWWSTQCLSGSSVGPPDCQRAFAGKYVSKSIEYMLGGPKSIYCKKT